MTALPAEFPAGRTGRDTQQGSAGGAPKLPTGHLATGDARTARARGDLAAAAATVLPDSTDLAPRRLNLFDPVLTMLADSLSDIEALRIASENRYRQLTRTEPDSDGLVRGFGVVGSAPPARALQGMVDQLRATEHGVDLQLRRQMRAHPLGPWAKAQRGVGDRQMARLLGAVGDPYWNEAADRPRTVAQLRAYCGYHVLPVAHGIGEPKELSGGRALQSSTAGVAAHRRRGERANWNPAARMRLHLIAESCMKASGEYRAVYDDGRYRYADSTHPALCVRCGPAGNPAAAGTPLSAAHQHARALRLVAKAFLDDLWRESRRLHLLAQGA